MQRLLRKHLGGDVMPLAKDSADLLVLAENRLEDEIHIVPLGLAAGLRAYAYGDVAADIGPPGDIDLLQQIGKRAAFQLRKRLERRTPEQFAGTDQLVEGTIGDLQLVLRPLGDGDEARRLVEQPLQVGALLAELPPMQLVGATLGDQGRDIAQGQCRAHHCAVRRTHGGDDDLQRPAASRIVVLQGQRRVAILHLCQGLAQLVAPERQPARLTAQYLAAAQTEQLGGTGAPVEHRPGAVETDDGVTCRVDEMVQIELRRG